jgi:hypothetical protein
VGGCDASWGYGPGADYLGAGDVVAYLDSPIPPELRGYDEEENGEIVQEGREEEEEGWKGWSLKSTVRGLCSVNSAAIELSRLALHPYCVLRYISY